MGQKRRVSAVMGLTVGLVLAAQLAWGEDAKPLVRLGVLAERGKEKVLTDFGPLADYLNQTVADRTFVVVPVDLKEVDSTISSKQVDYFLTQPSLYAELEYRYGVTRMATLSVRGPDGSGYTQFGGVIVARASRKDLQTLQDLKGKRFMGVGRASFGGMQMAELEFQRAGIDLLKDTKISYAGFPQEKAVRAVLNGEVDGATVRTGVLERMAKSGEIKLEDLRVINAQHYDHFEQLVSTTLYPEWAFASLKHADRQLSQRLAVALLSLPADHPAAKAAKITGFTVPLDYQPVHDLMKALRVGPYVDYGKVTVRDVMRQYWHVIAGSLTTLLLMALATVYVSRLNRQIELVMNNVDQGFITVDTEGRMATRMSAIVQKWLGARPASGRFTDYLRMVDAAAAASFDRGWGAVASGTTSLQSALDGLPKQATLGGRSLELQYLPVKKGEALHRLIIVLSDVTAQRERAEFKKMAEENRQLSETLSVRNSELAEALNRAHESARVKSEFLANTSHELRTPLNAIINIPQGLLDQIQEVRRVRCKSCSALFELDENESFTGSDPCPDCQKQSLMVESGHQMQLDPSETARLLRSVVGSGRHLLAVVNDILDYSKLEAGRMMLLPEHLDLAELLETLDSTMGPVAQRSGVTLAISKLDAKLEADRVKLMQVLINLIGNAIKFSDGKGTVMVTSSVTGSGASGRLSISVTDQGIGIAPQHQAMIFEGFRQVEGGNTRRFGGTGLGLAISKRLVELHGGRIRLDSTPGQGSTFTIELPLVAAQVEMPVWKESAEDVLVIDDEVSAVDATAAALKPLDCNIVAIRDPREALERMRAKRPALVILDVMMPRVSGIDLLKEMRSDPELKSIPVVVSSAYPDNRGVVEVLGAEFISKPWRPGELLRLVTDVLSERGRDGLTSAPMVH